jgi:hypothetical protein
VLQLLIPANVLPKKRWYSLARKLGVPWRWYRCESEKKNPAMPGMGPSASSPRPSHGTNQATEISVNIRRETKPNSAAFTHNDFVRCKRLSFIRGVLCRLAWNKPMTSEAYYASGHCGRQEWYTDYLQEHINYVEGMFKLNSTISDLNCCCCIVVREMVVFVTL